MKFLFQIILGVSLTQTFVLGHQAWSDGVSGENVLSSAGLNQALSSRQVTKDDVQHLINHLSKASSLLRARETKDTGMKTEDRSLKEELTAWAKLSGAVDRVGRVRRSVRDKAASWMSEASKDCGDEDRQKAQQIGVQSEGVYENCTGSAIYRAVGDSVSIASLALQMGSVSVKTLDDLLNGVTPCFQMGSTSCAVQALIGLGIDVYGTVTSARNIRPLINQLSGRIHHIIDICEHRHDQHVRQASAAFAKCS